MTQSTRLNSRHYLRGECMNAGQRKYILGSIFFAVVTLYLVYPFTLRAIVEYLVIEEPINSAYNSSRAKEAFSQAFSSTQLSVVSAPVQRLFDPNSWWTTRKGAKIVFKEYWEWLWNGMEE